MTDSNITPGPTTPEEALALVNAIESEVIMLAEHIPPMMADLASLRAYLETQAPPDPPDPPDPPAPPTTEKIWLDDAEILALPMEGAAWENVLDAAQNDTTRPDISNQNDSTDVWILAKALVYARTKEEKYLVEVVDSIMDAIGTEEGASILAVSRGLLPYVLAADIVNLREVEPYFHEIFSKWLAEIRDIVFVGAGPKLSVIQCHDLRPNNFGTHAGASRIAIARYLDDMDDLERAAQVFKGWLGDRSAYVGFNFGDLDWQSDPTNPVGINPVGATIDGHNVDGVLPDDQRRAGGFKWPPPRENYVWEAMQSATVQAELLTGAGFPAWEWQDKALLRAMTWLHEQANYPAEGDDRWIPWLVNAAYGTSFETVTPTTPGKGMGFTDWTHAPKK